MVYYIIYHPNSIFVMEKSAFKMWYLCCFMSNIYCLRAVETKYFVETQDFAALLAYWLTGFQGDMPDFGNGD